MSALPSSLPVASSPKSYEGVALIAPVTIPYSRFKRTWCCLVYRQCIGRDAQKLLVCAKNR